MVDRGIIEAQGYNQLIMLFVKSNHHHITFVTIPRCTYVFNKRELDFPKYKDLPTNTITDQEILKSNAIKQQETFFLPHSCHSISIFSDAS